LRVHTTNDSAG